MKDTEKQNVNEMCAGRHFRSKAFFTGYNVHQALRFSRLNPDSLQYKTEYRRNLVSAANTFQDLQRLHETADNTERYI